MASGFHVDVPGFDTEYLVRVHVRGDLILHPVRGFLVGRFAIRLMPDNSVIGWYDGSGGRRTNRFWVIDHVEASTGVVNVSTFEDAMIVADDLSRFAEKDVVGVDWDTIAKAMGPEIMDWCRYVASGKPLFGGFRAWRDKQDPYLLMTAHHLGLPYEEVKERYKAKDEVVRYWRMHMKKTNFSAGMTRKF